MESMFGIERERQNQLFFKSYKNDKSISHFHSQIELYFIDDGEMEATVNNHKATLKKGEMSVALSFNSHSYKTPVYSESSVLIIPLYMCEEFTLATQHKRIINPFIRNTETVREIKRFFKMLTDNHANEIELTGYIYVILGIIMKNIQLEESDEALNPDLSSKILFYINENFKSDLNLEILAAEFGYTQSYLSRHFKACFGIGINQYINNLRLKNTLMLLHEKKYSTTYCALESGFNSMRTFYRVFYNEFNCTPKEYLKNIM